MRLRALKEQIFLCFSYFLPILEKNLLNSKSRNFLDFQGLFFKLSTLHMYKF